MKANALGPNGERYLEFGYGGLELEYVPEPNKLIHLSFMMLIGGGGVGWRDDNEPMSFHRESDAFFVVEPAVHVTLNVTSFFRISAGASYRYISGVHSKVSSNADLSGPSGLLTLRFGKF